MLTGSYWPSPEAWRQILGEHADEIIDQAHEDAAEGKHLERQKKGRPKKEKAEA